LVLRRKHGVLVGSLKTIKLLQPPSRRLAQQNDVRIGFADETAQCFHFPVVMEHVEDKKRQAVVVFFRKTCLHLLGMQGCVGSDEEELQAQRQAHRPSQCVVCWPQSGLEVEPAVARQRNHQQHGNLHARKVEDADPPCAAGKQRDEGSEDQGERTDA
jgi:hypothetical protein